MSDIVAAIFSGDVVVRLGWTLVHFLWQGALLGLLARACLGLLKGASPHVRYNLACLFFLAMGLVPILTFTSLGAAAPITVGAAATTPQSVIVAAGEGAGNWAWSVWITSATPWLVLAWAVGVVLFTIRLLFGWQRVSRLKVEGLTEPPAQWQHTLDRLVRQFDLARPVRLATSLLVNVPTVVGPLRPLILMPASLATGFSSQQIEMILAHELAHVRRHDLLFNLVQIAVETLLFFHPAVHRLAARIRIEREKCCDDMAVTVCGEPVAYAGTLAALEEFRQRELRLGLAATGGHLLDRVQRLVSVTYRPQRGSALLGVVVALTVAAPATVMIKDNLFPPDRTDEMTQAGGQERIGTGPPEPSTETVARNTNTGTDAVSDGSRAAESSHPAVDPADPDSPGTGPRIGDARSTAALPAGDSSSSGPEPETSRPEAAEIPDPGNDSPTNGTRSAPDSRDTEATRENASPPEPETTDTAAGPSAGGGRGPAIGGPTGTGSADREPGDAASKDDDAGTSKPESEAPITGGDVIDAVRPAYPRRMLRRGDEGRVVVEFTVTPTGNVTDVVVNETQTTSAFEEAAEGFESAVREAVAQWRFEPFRKGQQPVERRLSREFVFEPDPEADSSTACRQTGTRISRC